MLCQSQTVEASFQLVMKTACQPVVMKNVLMFWHLPRPLATPYLIFKFGLAPFHPDEAEWR